VELDKPNVETLTRISNFRGAQIEILPSHKERGVFARLFHHLQGKEILNRVQNDSYGELTVCHPCETVDQNEILNQVQNDSYADLADCHPCKIIDTNKILNQLMTPPTHTGSVDSSFVASLCKVQNDSYEDFDRSNSCRFENMKKSKTSCKKVAFTLAEVLIAIGIIGVVAAMTIPNLINDSKARQLRSQFLKSYSTISQALRAMEADDIPITKDAYTGGSMLFSAQFIKYLDGAKFCPYLGDVKNASCAILINTKGTVSYKTLFGSEISYLNKFDDGQIILKDGTLLFFEDSYASADALWISVDINGVNGKPNLIGYDVFTFELNNHGKLIPMGAPETYYKNYKCKNGQSWACAYNALTDPDYFKWVVKNAK
jgi:type II secretory pathway pseudopilin PulG